jgi:hypothetical protein
MSEMSLLWHEYRRFNDLARDITDDVMLLQRVRLHLPGHNLITREQLENSRLRLEQFVAALVTFLQPDQKSRNGEELRLPGTLVERIRKANSGPLPRFMVELNILREHLADGEQPLTDQDMLLLDSLVNSVNQETSRVFNRLWRK